MKILAVLVVLLLVATGAFLLLWFALIKVASRLLEQIDRPT